MRMLNERIWLAIALSKADAQFAASGENMITWRSKSAIWITAADGPKFLDQARRVPSLLHDQNSDFFKPV